MAFEVSLMRVFYADVYVPVISPCCKSHGRSSVLPCDYSAAHGENSSSVSFIDSAQVSSYTGKLVDGVADVVRGLWCPGAADACTRRVAAA